MRAGEPDVGLVDLLQGGQQAGRLVYGVEAGDPDPRCPSCGGITRATVILFEEPLERDVLDAACDAAGASHRRMASGAGHDTAFMAKVTRAAMIFVPCLGGRSHAPEEFAEIDDIALGAAVLLNAVIQLDEKLQDVIQEGV